MTPEQQSALFAAVALEVGPPPAKGIIWRASDLFEIRSIDARAYVLAVEMVLLRTARRMGGIDLLQLKKRIAVQRNRFLREQLSAAGGSKRDY